MSAPTCDPQPEACFGMTCPHRSSCALFDAIGVADGHVIATCQRGVDDWPLFILKGESSPATPSQ